MFLGIDIGTSGVKAVALDESGAVAGQGTAALSVQRPQPSWSEQDPEAWWRATTAAVQALDPALRRAVRGIGIAGQMHGATLLGADDRPLRPAILWNDGRSDAECEELEARVPELRRITGNIAMPGFTAPKLLWVRKNEPDVFGRIETVLLPKDYVRLCMTGDKATDLSDAAGTLWVDVASRSWSEEVLAATGLGLRAMPRLHEGSEQTGSLRAEIAELWGMPRVPVVAGGGDNAAGAVGVGVVRDGDALLSLGTSGVIFVATDEFRPNPDRAVHSFCHCLPGMWHQMSVHLSAASCVDWVARLTGASGAAELFARAEEVGPGSGNELFLPYLSGERTPHNDARVRGAFLGLDHDTDPGRLAQVVLEGVAFALADGLDALRDAGTRVAELSVIGGGARSRYWGSILSAAFEVPLVYLKGGEVGPALGAARLAQLGVDGGNPAHVCARPPVSHRIQPDPSLIERLAHRKSAFREAYPRITPKRGH
ncbi:xylulokinase [Altererythrobacter atlanticus]|uniref:Xylulose kinase n=1 Tax=Croceibacterium atlanticum TaxID=1267766 RepID=A0A0F7KRZ3_9SPHN|nr:xylulokinase [Croceibacterium atlanticum]AKH43228.1 Xylulose kinase [Croceibacterium atlanticum]MBB5732067.1 xylulokinase [Croceibacterium atlanticum]